MSTYFFFFQSQNVRSQSRSSFVQHTRRWVIGPERTPASRQSANLSLSVHVPSDIFSGPSCLASAISQDLGSLLWDMHPLRELSVVNIFYAFTVYGAFAHVYLTVPSVVFAMHQPLSLTDNVRVSIGCFILQQLITIT